MKNQRIKQKLNSVIQLINSPDDNTEIKEQKEVSLGLATRKPGYKGSLSIIKKEVKVVI